MEKGSKWFFTFNPCDKLFELTSDNYKQPTTLPLRTYYLTTFLPLRTQGALKEDRRNIYEWDLVGCMGKIPTHVWVRYLNDCERTNGEWQDRFSANPNGAPWVIWNRIGWKCVMLRVIPNEELGKMWLSECRGQTCLNYAEREHLRRSQLGMRNWISKL